MWISKQIIKEQKVPAVECGKVTMSSKGAVEATSTGVERNVNFLGYRTDNHALYQAFDVYCMPSFYEGLPVALVEAQASGLPIVFSNTITEEINISKKQNIQLSLEKDNKEWVEALIEISNRQINRKINGELIQKSIFNIENAIGLLENKYQELIVRESFR